MDSRSARRKCCNGSLHHGMYTLLAITCIELKKVLVYIVLKFISSATEFWHNTTLIVAIDTYAIAVRNRKAFTLLRAHETRDYFRYWEEGTGGRFSWLLYRLIAAFLDSNAPNTKYVKDSTPAPFSDEMCGLEHTLVHITVQLAKLFLLSSCCSVFRFLLRRLEFVLRSSINNNLRMSLLAVLLAHHFAQPYEVLEKQCPGERTTSLREDSASVSGFVTKIIDKLAPPLNNLIIMMYMNFVSHNTRIADTSISTTELSERNSLRTSSIAATISDSKTMTLIAIAFLPLPLNMLLIALTEKQKVNRSKVTRLTRAQTISALNDAMARHKLIKLYNSELHEITEITSVNYMAKSETAERTFISSVSRAVKLIVSRYTSAVATLGTTVYMFANLITYNQAKQIKYFIHTLTVHITHLAELPSICIDACIHVTHILKELAQDQEPGSLFYPEGGFMVTYAYVKDHWATVKACHPKQFPLKRIVIKVWQFVLAAISSVGRITMLVVPNALLVRLFPARMRECRGGKKPRKFNEKEYVEELRALKAASIAENTMNTKVSGSTARPDDDDGIDSLLLLKSDYIYPCTPIIVEFRNVTFSYKDDKPVLHNLNLTISPGQKIAIVGHSGIGKSTISNLLTRLYAVNKSGADTTVDSSPGIYFNNQNIEDIPLADLRQMVTILPQDNTLVKGSMTDNILYGQPRKLPASYTQDEQDQYIRNLIRLSYRGACVAEIEDLFSDRPYSGMVSCLSGGQRQRVCMARAVIRGGSILVLDEATSALDEKVEKHVIQNMFQAFDKNQTVIVITHRLSTLRQVDLIYVLGNPDGRGAHVVESGGYEWFTTRSRYITDITVDLS